MSSGLSNTISYTEDGPAQVLSPTVAIFDAELSALDDFNNTSLTLSRNGGAHADDVFSATGNLALNAGTLELSTANVGTYTQSAGQLALTFAAGVSNAQVNEIMRSLAYSNTNDTPPATVQVDWAFSDENSGSQGIGGALTATGSTTVNITAANDEQLLSSNTGATVAEGSTGNVLTALMLQTTDADNTDDQLVYAIDAITSNGTLRLNGTALGLNDTFTQTDINTGHITYDHDGSQTATDSFDFTVDDGVGATTSATFTFTVTNINDAPVIVNNTGMTVAEGSTTTISTTMLSATDIDDADASLVFHITSAPSGGQLESINSTGVALSSFTLQNLIDNEIVYVNFSDSDADDAFDIEIRDGGEHGVTFPSATFSIVVSPDSITTVPDTLTTIAGAPIVLDPLINDTDTQGDALSVIGIVDSAGDNESFTLTNPGDTATLDTGTTIALRADGRLDVIAARDGTETFSYRVSDGGDADTSTVTLNTTTDETTAQAVGFVTTWDTTLSGTSANDTIELMVNSGSDDFTVFWGDGTHTSGVNDDISHTYATSGQYTVSIVGDFAGFHFDSSGDIEKLTSIEQWGNVAFEDFTESFSGASNVVYNASDIPDLTGVRSFREAFAYSIFNSDISGWDVSGITDFEEAFRSNKTFNQDISGWDVSGGEDFTLMFFDADAFDQDISGWDVGSAQHLRSMFMFTALFNADISGWETGNVTSMNDMFRDADAFNQPIQFTAGGGNQGGDAWDTSKVETMDRMFYNSNLFNQDISNWDTSSVESMLAMFSGARDFDQDISSWDISKVTDMTQMLDNSGLSVTNYDALLVGWASQSVQPNVTLGATGMVYSEAAFAARASLINDHGWTIVGDSTVNDAPGFSGTLDATPTVIENGAAVVLDTNVAVVDAELSAFDNFDGATLTLLRNGGAHSDDQFEAASAGTLGALTEGGSLVVSGTTIGTVTTNSAGTLVLGFNVNATNALVDSAMQQIAYTNTSEAPPAIVQIDWTFDDGNSGVQGGGGALTATGSTTVSVTAVNDAPVAGSIESADLAYTENDGSVAITSTLVLSDLDDTDLESATASITSNFASAEDVLTFANTATITGVWNAGSGILQLSGTDTLAAYEAALRSVTYHNTSENPNTAVRTVSFTVNDGDTDSTAVTRDITINAVNDKPVIALIASGALAYQENDSATRIASALTVSDPDDINIESATVRITANFVDSEDVLAFTDTANITGSWDVASGVLTLSGTDTLANYQAALRAVNYRNTSDDPVPLTRTVSFALNDGDTSSSTQTRDIAITAVNDAPVIVSLETADLAYTENDGAVAITTALTLNDHDDTDLESATVTISAGYVNGEDILAFNTQNGITGSWDAANGVLTLTGTSSVAHYEAALRSVTYVNTADDPDTTTRTVSFVVNDGDVDGNAQGRDIVITAVNDAPVAGSIESADIAYTENDGAVVITSALLLSDIDDTNLESATVTVTNNYVNGEDLLTVADQSGITGSWDSATGVLTLSGNSSIANYQAALRSVTYTNTSDDLNTATRTASFVVNDGDVNSNAQSRDIAMTAVNDAPVTGSIESADIAYTENDGAVAITSALVLSDVDDTDLESATVTLSANYVNGEDVLTFADQNGITGSWDSSTGILTLTGTSSAANYQTALRSVTYTNTSDDLNTATRTVSFVVNDGDVDSNAQSRDIAITAVNDAPVAGSIESANIAYTENDGAVAITSALVLSDVDDTALESATVTISNNYFNGEDRLTVVDQNGITGSWDSATGVLTLSGTSSAANYQTALRSVTYTNTSDDLSTATRTVSFVVNDGGVNSNAQSRDIAMTAVNDAPVAGSIESADITYTENDGAVAITSALMLSDVDDTDLESATVTFSANYVNGEDVLTFADQNGITGSWDSATGVLTLSGTSSVANYQTALRSVTYTNTSDDLSTATRTVSFVVNDGDVNSNAQSRDIAISAVNDAPVAGSIESADLAYTENDGAVAITSALVLSDVDDTDLESATVTLSANYVNGEDVLTFSDQNGITGSWDNGTGLLTLTGTSSVANYQTALRSVTYTNTSDDLSTATRTVSFVVNDGDVNSNTQSRDIAISAVNDAPAAGSIESADLAYTENDGAVAITSALVLSDVDDTDLESATVTLSANYVNGEDLLTFADQNGITGSWDSGTGVLTLSGTSSVANYQTALRSVTYTNTSDDLNTATRTVSFVVNDGDVDSNTQSRDIAISAVNDAPVAGSIESADLAYTENDGAIAITSALMLSDVDDTDLESATVTLSANYVNGEDVLTFSDQNGITGSWDSSTGILTLSGTSSVADYETALRSVTYTNTADDPSTTTRTVSFMLNDGYLNSSTQSRDIAITAINDAPVAALIEDSEISYIENDTPTAITSSLTLDDLDDTQLESATVSISAHYAHGEDILSVTDQQGITGSWRCQLRHTDTRRHQHRGQLSGRSALSHPIPIPLMRRARYSAH